MCTTYYLTLGNTRASLRLGKNEEKNRMTAQKISRSEHDNKRKRTLV